MTPIEQKLWDAMGACWDSTDVVRRVSTPKLSFDDLAEWHSVVHQMNDVIAVCAPQVAHDPYLVDFGLYCVGDISPIRVAIECDGHDFHERTKEQAARDRARDRRMLADRVLVLRFTGSEVWRDDVACVIEITRAVGNELQRQTEIHNVWKGMQHAS